MSLEKVNWQTLLVIVPLAHLIVVSIYLWCWFIGFGAHAIVLADARDVFSLSISEIIPIYINGLILPVAMTAYRYSWKYPTAQDRMEAITDPEVRASQARSDGRMRFILLGGVTILVLQSLVLGIDGYLRGNPITIFINVILVFPGIMFLLLLRHKVPMSNVRWEGIILATGFLLSALSTGIGNGQFDRYRTYDSSRAGFLHCGRAVVLRRLGDRFIGVVSTDQKVVTDLQCKIIMVIPPHRFAAERKLQWWWPFVRYEPVKQTPAKPTSAVTAPGSGSPRQTTPQGV